MPKLEGTIALRDTESVSFSKDEGDQVGGVCSWLRSSHDSSYECQTVRAGMTRRAPTVRFHLNGMFDFSEIF